MINSKKELMQYLKYIKFTGECELHNFIFYRGKYFKFKIEPIVYKNKILSQVDYSTLEPNKCYISEIKRP